MYLVSQSVRFVRKGQQSSKRCDYLDSLGGVGEAYGIHAIVRHSGLQELRTVPESEQVPTGHTGDFWHHKALQWGVNTFSIVQLWLVF